MIVKHTNRIKLDILNESKSSKQLNYNVPLSSFIHKMLDYFGINYEYFDLQLGVNIGGVICNYIEFPFNENRMVGMTKGDVDSLCNKMNKDKAICAKVGGPAFSFFLNAEMNDSWYIFWNAVDQDDYQYIDKETLKQMFEYE